MWCSKGTFSWQVKYGAKSCQASSRSVTYTLQEPFKKELEGLQGRQIIPYRVHEPVEWSISFVIVPKPNGTV